MAAPDTTGERQYIEQFSEQAKAMLQRAAERAVQGGRREVDTEHLLYVLPQSDAIQAIPKQFNVSPADLHAEIGKFDLQDSLDQRVTAARNNRVGVGE